MFGTTTQLAVSLERFVRKSALSFAELPQLGEHERFRAELGMSQPQPADGLKEAVLGHATPVRRHAAPRAQVWGGNTEPRALQARRRLRLYNISRISRGGRYGFTVYY